MKRIACVIAAVTFAASFNAYAEENHHAHSGHQVSHWGYEGEAGPEHWGELKSDFATCRSGIRQSPVDLKKPIKAELAPLAMHYKAVPLQVSNNGHTIQVNQKGAGTLTFRGQNYQLLQFHFHTPSEHQVQGQARAMEAHFVHKSDSGQLAVVGVMINAGKENAALKSVWDSMPKEAKNVDVQGAMINAADILPADKSYEHYIGSLTTPPCSEGVRWIVLNEPIEMSQAQIDSFKSIFSHNARPVQPMNARFLLENSM